MLPLWNQNRLAEASALVVGVGGLGTPAALYLCAMGIGRLVLCDPDTIAPENLHRQPLYAPDQIGLPKVQVLSKYLQKLRPDLLIETHECWADEVFLQTVGATADIWIDGTDNLPSRLLMDEIAHHLQKPWVYGAIFQWEGQVILWHGLRYKTYFGEASDSPSCSEAGVLGALPGLIGSWQAALAAMYLVAPHTTPLHRLFRIDLLHGTVQAYELTPPTPHKQANQPPPENLPLEITLEELTAPHLYHWIDIREEGDPKLPFPHERLPWYSYDCWHLPASSSVILVCETGLLSRTIAFALRRKLGRNDIMSLRGGVNALSRTSL